MWTRNPCCWSVKHLPCSVERSTSIISTCPSFKVRYAGAVLWSSSAEWLKQVSAPTVCVPSFLSERLTDTLRMNPTAAISAQIFLMFRVLLLRISSHHLTSLWPIMVTELVRFSKLTLHIGLEKGLCFWKLFFFFSQIRIFTRLENTLQSEKDISK